MVAQIRNLGSWIVEWDIQLNWTDLKVKPTALATEVEPNIKNWSTTIGH